ncbi:AAA family ATPase [bacterium]|nr:AAA family ATPase [bacterium]
MAQRKSNANEAVFFTPDDSGATLARTAGHKIFGHRETVLQLEKQVAEQRTPHALLFSGPLGVGKRAVAQHLARKLLRAENLEHHPDFFVVSLEEGKKDIPAETIRALISELQLKPFHAANNPAACRVAIIDQAQRMSNAAISALLKTLEEPTAHTHIILISDSAHRLIETIISRCQLFHFGLLAKADLENLLKSLLPEEKQISKALLQLLEGSVAPLNLGGLVNLRSLQLENPKNISKHLIDLEAAVSDIALQIDQFFKANFSPTSCLRISTYLAQSKERLTLAWPLLRAKLREQFLSHDARPISEVSYQLVQTQQLIEDRNAQAELQLNEFFLNTRTLLN